MGLLENKQVGYDEKQVRVNSIEKGNVVKFFDVWVVVTDIVRVDLAPEAPELVAKLREVAEAAKEKVSAGFDEAIEITYIVYTDRDGLQEERRILPEWAIVDLQV